MSKRVLALVQRSGNGANVTDKTPTVVWEHEVPILEEIHGEGAVTVIDDVEDLLDDAVIKGRKENLAHIVKVNKLGEEFAGDPGEEYQRMILKYGMHIEVKMSNVEKVYGAYRDGAFKKACGGDDLEDLAMPKLRELCDELGIPYKASDKRNILAAQIRNARQEKRDEQEIAAKKAA